MTASVSYDYVIVGAGSAGCVLANRLTEDQNVSVLVLEAGGPATGFFKDMPLAFPRYVLRRDLNWNFQSEPEPYVNGRIIEIPRGKSLGGSTTINGMVYARGHRLDYDDWARSGLKGWGYRDVLPYFKRSEKSWLGEGRYHGGSGPMHVVVPRTNQMYEELRAATVAAGYPATDDYHGAQTEGAQRNEMTITAGRRGNVARLFLKPALARGNLTVESRCHATRILFDGRRAGGVEFVRDGHKYSARAQRELILAGGTYGSPQLLMLSGIGPAAELKKHGIAPLIDLPGVGQNLVEHPFAPAAWRARPGAFRSELRVDRAAIWVLRWYFFGTGLYATNGAAGNVFIRTQPGLDRPDMQFTCMASGISTPDVSYPLIGKRPEHQLRVGISMIKQDSRGFVTLRSADPFDPPRIQFNLFQERSDVERFIRGVRALRAIYNNEPLKNLHLDETIPGEGVRADRDIEKWVREVGAITQHPVGTCRMGAGGDAHAVVDGELKVCGVESLRVIDASIMPNVPGGNTNAPTIMIAEKGADLLRGRGLPPAEV